MTTQRTNRNKITTQAYFISRLRDNGYVVDRLYGNYGDHDPRVWTVIIDPGKASVFCTCLRNVDQVGDAYFELYDASQFVPKRLKISTDSIEVIITYLHNLGVINKTAQYNEHGPKRLWATEDAKSTTTNGAWDALNAVSTKE